MLILLLNLHSTPGMFELFISWRHIFKGAGIAPVPFLSRKRRFWHSHRSSSSYFFCDHIIYLWYSILPLTDSHLFSAFQTVAGRCFEGEWARFQLHISGWNKKRFGGKQIARYWYDWSQEINERENGLKITCKKAKFVKGGKKL